MSPLLLAALYGLLSGLLGSTLAAVLALITRRRIDAKVVGTALGVSAGFILGAAFFDLLTLALKRSHTPLIVGIGLAVGLLLMVGLGFLLGAFGLGEEQEKQEEGGGAQADQTSSSQRKQSARGIAIGIAIHDIPEALPIGAVLAVSPVLSLLIALVLAVEELAESNAIAAELSQSKVSNAYLFWQTCWPSLFGVIGAPLGVLLAGISPLVLAFALSGAAGIMLFISGEIWGDSREDAGVAFSSIGMLAGVLLALFTSSIGPT